MKRRFLAVLAIMMLFSASSLTSSATENNNDIVEEIVIEDSDEDDTITENKEEIEIENTAATANPADNFKYNEDKTIVFGLTQTAIDQGISDIIIPEGVEIIAKDAFNGVGITSVLLPSTLTDIKKGAFSNNPGLREITIPKGMVAHGETFNETEAMASRFYNCTGLKKVIFEDGLETIPDGILYGAKYVEEVVIPASVTTIQEYAFFDCESLTTITTPGLSDGEQGRNLLPNVEIIYNRSFRNTKSLHHIEIPKVHFIGKMSFQHSALDEIELTDNLTEIHVYAFDDCDNLRELTIPEGIEFGGEQNSTTGNEYSTFAECDNLKTIRFADGTQTISAYVLKDAKSVETVIIPDTVEVIEHDAFRNMTELKYVKNSESSIAINGVLTLPKQLKQIDDKAFRYCTSVSKVIVPAGLTTVGSDPIFYGCSGLTTVEIEDGAISIPDNLLAYGENVRSIIIPDSVQDIYGNSLSGCISLEEIRIPSGLKSVHNSAVFKKCTSLRTVTIANGMTTIPDNMLLDAASVTSIIIPDSVKRINSLAFKGCSSLQQITLPKNIESLASSGVFVDCNSLNSIKIEDGATSIPTYLYTALPANDALTVTLPDSIRKVSWRAYYNSTMSSIILPSGITIIEGGAFENCQNITTITLPNSILQVEQIADRSNYCIFKGCSNLREVIFEDGIVKIPDNILNGANMVTETIIPDSVKEIGVSSFRNSGLDKIELPSGLTKVNNSSFANCKALSEVTIPKSLTDFPKEFGTGNNERGVFEGCTGLKNVIFASGTSSIPDYALYNAQSVTSIEGLDNVNTIGDHAFEGLSAMTELIIPDNVESLGDCVFFNCSKLARIYILNNEIVIGENVVNNKSINTIYCYLNSNAHKYAVDNKIKHVAIGLDDFTISGTIITGLTETGLTKTDFFVPEGITEIDNGVFKNNTLIESIHLPNSLKVIDYDAFNGCSNLKEIVLPAGLEHIYSRAFSNCTSLTSITLPANVVFNDKTNPTFNNCSNLNELRFAEGTEYIPNDTFSGMNMSSLTIYIPNSVKGARPYAYRDSTGIKDVAIVFAEGREEIPSCFFASSIADGTANSKVTSNLKVTSIYLPDSIKRINCYGLAGLTSLTSIELPEGLKVIGGGAFYGDSSLTELTIPSTVEIIDRETYPVTAESKFDNKSPATGIIRGCTSLTKVTLADGMIKMPAYMLSGSTYLKEVVLPDSLTEIGECAFWGDYGLTDSKINIPQRLVKIGDSAFKGCYGLTKIVLPDTLKEIGSEVFSECKSIVVTIPESVDTIGSNIMPAESGYTKKIICYSDTCAHTYAVDNKISYELKNNSFQSVSGSLAFNGEVGIVFTLNNVGEWCSDPNTVAELTFDNKVTNIKINTLATDDNNVKITYNVPIKDINEVVTLRIIDAEGRPVVNATNNKASFSYSVENYIASARKNNSTNKKLMDFLDAFENYAVYSRNYFCEENGVGSKADAMNDISLGSIGVDKCLNISGEVEGVSYVGSSLILKTGTTERYYFTINNDDVDTIEFSVNETIIKPQRVDASNMYYIDICNIAPNKLDTCYKIKIEDTRRNEVLNIEGSALSYAYKALSQKNNSKLKDVTKALILFNTAANNYFGD